MKLILTAVVAIMSIHAHAAEITPREWVGFLHQISKRGQVQLKGERVIFGLERRTTDGKEADYLTLVGVRDEDGDFVPTGLVQVEQAQQEGGFLVTVTQVTLGGDVKSVQSRLLTPQSSQTGSGDPPELAPTEAQKAEWAGSLQVWREQISQMPDRVGRFDAKETAI